MSTQSVLRAVANRLAVCATEELPRQVGFLSTSIASCGDALRFSKTGDDAVIIHKIKTKTSALLQDRTYEGRLSGIVITRALIEAGGVEILGESSNWVRNLITCLNKSDAWEVKRLCILTITRIYLLTKDQQALVREITTPTLPAFITASLNVTKPTIATHDGNTSKYLSPLLSVVLRSWTALIQYFAPTFRPNTPAIRSICLSLLSDASCSNEAQMAATALLGRLHFCAAKSSGASEWAQTCLQAIEAAHDTIDLAFRAIVEDWTPVTTRTSKATRKQRLASVPATTTADLLGFDKWQGVTEGCRRITAHVGVLTTLLTSRHSNEVTMPFASVLDLTSRLAAVTPPTSKFSLRTNNEITRDEREELWLYLSQIHEKVLELFTATVHVMGQAMTPMIQSILQQAWDVLHAHTNVPTIRARFYKFMAIAMRHNLIQFEKADSANLKRLISSCCTDIRELGNVTGQPQTMLNGNAPEQNGNAQITIKLDRDYKTSLTDTMGFTYDQYSSAWNLVPVMLEHIPFHVLSGGSTLRAQLDGQAIISQHHEALLASVLYPLRPLAASKTEKAGVPNSSLLPFLAQAGTPSGNPTAIPALGAEALLRPRVSVIQALGTAGTASAEVNGAESDPESDDSISEVDGRTVQDQRIDTEVSVKNYKSDGLDTAMTELGASKRDFTAILEASTDAQLAASAVESRIPDTEQLRREAEENVPALKRQRLDVDDMQIQTNVADSMPQSQDTESHTIDFPQGSNVNMSLINTTPINSETTLSNKKVTKPAYKYEDSDSDSEIPPIDATLAVLTDSEEEVDD